jgi:glycolate oxidase
MSLYDYNPVTETIIQELVQIVGERFVITDREKIEPFSHDEVAEQEYACMPEVVVRPRTADEISRIVNLAN